MSSGDDRTGVAIIRGVKDNPAPVSNGADRAAVDQPDPGLEEARRLLGELDDATGAESLAPAEQLADLLEDLLEGREGERS